MIEPIYLFFVKNFPSINDILIYSLPFTLLAYSCLYFAAFCKKHFQLETGLSRKIFHAQIFLIVSILQFSIGLPLMCLFGGCCSFIVLYALLQKRDHSLLSAIAREKDEPHERQFIAIPYLSTFAGGVLSNAFFPSVSFCGYLVTGVGDACGEVFGVLWGKKKYRPYSIFGINKEKSYIGSFSVFIGSFIAVFLFTIFHGIEISWLTILLVCLLGMLIEAFSPPAMDNFFMQIIPNMLLFYFIY